MKNSRKAAAIAALTLAFVGTMSAATVEAATWHTTCATGRVCLWGGGGVGNYPVAGLSGAAPNGDNNFGTGTNNNMFNSGGSVNRTAQEGASHWQNNFAAGGSKARAYLGTGYTTASPTYCVNAGGTAVGAYSVLSSYSSSSGLSSLGWGSQVGC